MIRRPPISTRTDTLFPYPTLFRSTLAQQFLVRHERLVKGSTPPAASTLLVGRRRIGRLEQLVHGIARFCRSEEHTSELQSLMRISYAVFCLKKKKKNNNKCDV